MLDDYGFEIYEENTFPLAYLITFRTFGTWLHGDERFSVGRNGRNAYGTPKIQPNVGLAEAMREKTPFEPVILTREMRSIVEQAVSDICQRRSYGLQALNVRSNHVHAVISAQKTPERIADGLKANATKFLREAHLIGSTPKVWARGRSRRYLWKPEHVVAAIDYVLYSQGDTVFELSG